MPGGDKQNTVKHGRFHGGKWKSNKRKSQEHISSSSSKRARELIDLTDDDPAETRAPYPIDVEDYSQDIPLNSTLGQSDIYDSQRDYQPNRSRQAHINKQPQQRREHRSSPDRHERGFGGLRTANSRGADVPHLIHRDAALHQMSQEVMKLYESTRQDEGTYSRKLQLVDILYNTISPTYPGCGLYLVGSSVNGFGQKYSDVDLCLMLSDSEVSWNDALNILYKIQRLISRLSMVRACKVIRATVPILDFRDSRNTEVDMNINNETGIRNSHLLNVYSRYDWRVPPLVVFIKHWASFQNINSAKDNTLSSYVLTLMVIHYLQCGVEGTPVLPCLQEQHKDIFYHTAVRDLRMDIVITPPTDADKNQLNLAQLLMGFFNYYTNEFKFDRQVASVRSGLVLDISLVRNRPLISLPGGRKGQTPRNTWSDALLFVEDPIIMTNAARNVYNYDAFTRVKRVMRKSAITLNQTLDPQAIITHPF